MDTLVYNSQNSKITVDDNQSAKKYIVKEEYILNHLIIHYAHPGYGGTCYYHVIVDKKTRLLVGWGFDEDKGNPKVCGVAGQRRKKG